MKLHIFLICIVSLQGHCEALLYSKHLDRLNDLVKSDLNVFHNLQIGAGKKEMKMAFQKRYWVDTSIDLKLF